MARVSYLRILPAAVALGVALTGCLPEGNVDSTNVDVKVDKSSLTISGWAWDQDAPTTSIDVHIYVDGAFYATKADTARPDVAAAKPGAGPNHGYRATVNVAAGSHSVCVYGINVPGTPGDNSLIGCRTAEVPYTAPTTTPKTAPGSGPSSGGGTTTPGAWQDDLVNRVNTARSFVGAPPVARCAALDTAAQSYADTMATNQWFDATGPDGSEAWTRVAAYGGTSTGENLAFGFDSPAALNDGMLASSSQSTNVLRPEFTHVGVGRVLGDPDGSGPQPAAYYWVEEFGASGTC